jgi:hypothetical protein
MSPESGTAGMPGSDAANQTKTEPMPPAEGHADPAAAPQPSTVKVPDLDGMNVGSSDPQSPSHPAVAATPEPATTPERATASAAYTPVLPGGDPRAVLPAAHTGSTTGRTSGPLPPVQDTHGAGYRAPGSMGTTGPDEQIETDVERSAHNANVLGAPGTARGPGDAAGVPVVSGEAAPGSSEDSAVSQGVRTPR